MTSVLLCWSPWEGARVVDAQMVEDRERPGCRVALLGCFELRVADVWVELPRATERLLAYLALQPLPVSRDRVAAALWPDASEQRALGCLRSALWRVRAASRSLLLPDNGRLGLAPGTGIDIVLLASLARQLGAGGHADVAATIPSDLFGTELLPGWDEEWVLLDRERLRQVSLSGLDALSRRHLEAGRVFEALEAAWRAIALEPLRESAHHTLIDAHLADGNIGEAVRGLRSFEVLLDREIGIAPSPALVRRVTEAVAGRQSPRVPLRA
jgi:DNA-binding SARP family transcriptional activator